MWHRHWIENSRDLSQVQAAGGSSLGAAVDGGAKWDGQGVTCVSVLEVQGVGFRDAWLMGRSPLFSFPLLPHLQSDGED